MKWNWGTKIALFYSSFVAFILFMVLLSANEHYDLVTEDYYAAEINYQKTIDSKSRADKLNTSLFASIEKGHVVIHFPHKGYSISGEINCFRPSDESKDFKLSIQTEDNSYSIPIKRFIKGKYLLKVDWEVDQVNYYHELNVIIP